MKKIVAACALILAFSNVVLAREPFECHLATDDKAVDLLVKSFPMLGHGLEHYAVGDVTYLAHHYSFTAQASLYSDTISIELLGNGLQIVAKDELLFVGKPGEGALSVNCKRIK